MKALWNWISEIDNEVRRISKVNIEVRRRKSNFEDRQRGSTLEIKVFDDRQRGSTQENQILKVDIEVRCRKSNFDNQQRGSTQEIEFRRSTSRFDAENRISKINNEGRP